jgi:hypothetical protein
MALTTLTSGGENTAVGRYVLGANTTGSGNTANGTNSLFANISGSQNTANGYMALFYNTTGSNNVANGNESLMDNTTSGNNTGIGNESGKINTTGSFNTYLGAKADAGPGLTALTKSTAIGYNAKVTESNQIMLGTATESVVIPGPKLTVSGTLTINPIDVSIAVNGIQSIDESLKFTIPNSMTALKYFCTAHPGMIGDFTLASLSTETDKTYYVRMVATDPQTPLPIIYLVRP